jgi:shikimate kinase
MATTRHVVLVGLMASGKTTVGEPLAARLGRPFVDNDVVLQARTGRTARQIADAEGADALHRHEAEALVEALAGPVPAVVAAAAAAPLDATAAAALRSHDVIYLRATPAVLAARLAHAPVTDDHRPFVRHDDHPSAGRGTRAVLDEQFAARDERYRALAMLTVDADGAGHAAIVDEITAALARGSSRTRPGS